MKNAKYECEHVSGTTLLYPRKQCGMQDKQELWEGIAVAVEAVGEEEASKRRDAQAHVVTYTPLYVGCNPANANKFVDISTITKMTMTFKI